MIASKLQMVPSTDKIMFPVIKVFNTKNKSLSKNGLLQKSKLYKKNNNKQNKYDKKNSSFNLNRS